MMLDEAQIKINGEVIPVMNVSIDVDLPIDRHDYTDQSFNWLTKPTMAIKATPYPDAVHRLIAQSKRKICFTCDTEWMQSFKVLDAGSVINFSAETNGMIQDIRNYKIVRRDYKRNKIWMVEV